MSYMNIWRSDATNGAAGGTISPASRPRFRAIPDVTACHAWPDEDPEAGGAGSDGVEASERI